MSKKLTIKQAEQWFIDNNINERYKILRFSGGTQKSLFLDIKRDRKFERSFSQMKCEFNRNKETEFGSTRMESFEKQKQTMVNRYGCEYPLQNKEINKKQTQTMIDCHGVEYAIHNK